MGDKLLRDLMSLERAPNTGHVIGVPCPKRRKWGVASERPRPPAVFVVHVPRLALFLGCCLFRLLFDRVAEDIDRWTEGQWLICDDVMLKSVGLCDPMKGVWPLIRDTWLIEIVVLDNDHIHSGTGQGLTILRHLLECSLAIPQLLFPCLQHQVSLVELLEQLLSTSDPVEGSGGLRELGQVPQVQHVGDGKHTTEVADHWVMASLVRR